MSDSKSNSKTLRKVNFIDLNVKPFVDKKNKFDRHLFNPKFSQAFSKILQIKEIKWSVAHQKSQVIYGKSLERLPKNSHLIQISYQDKKIGWLYFSPQCAYSLIHRLLGGRANNEDNVLPMDKDLTAMGLKTLSSLYAPLELCLREALTPMLHLHDASLKAGPHPRDFALKEQTSYFVEHFALGPPKQEQSVMFFLEVQAF